MPKIVKVRKIGTSLGITVDKGLCELFGIKEGTELEIDPLGSDSFRIKVK